MESDQDATHRARGRVVTCLPILAGVSLLVAGLGMTCQEYLDLPPAGGSPVFIQSGFWELGVWAVNYKGDVEYDAYWLGQIDDDGTCFNCALWEIVSSQMRIGASRATLNILEPQGFDYVMSVKLDIYGYDSAQQDWVRRNDETLLGVSYLVGLLTKSEQCDASKPADPFQPQELWTVICGVVPEKRGVNGGANVHANAPYGVLHLFFGVTTDIGSCTGLLGICNGEDWKHRIP